MRDLDQLFTALGRSRFRSRFRLGSDERRYLDQKGLATVLEHARRFVTERLAPAAPRNDGRQTPMRGHPVFLAQHATGTCCRGCLAKWHAIPVGKPLLEGEIDYVLQVLRNWLERQLSSSDAPQSSSKEGVADPQMPLFESDSDGSR